MKNESILVLVSFLEKIVFSLHSLITMAERYLTRNEKSLMSHEIPTNLKERNDDEIQNIRN